MKRIRSDSFRKRTASFHCISGFPPFAHSHCWASQRWHPTPLTLVEGKLKHRVTEETYRMPNKYLLGRLRCFTQAGNSSGPFSVPSVTLCFNSILEFRYDHFRQITSPTTTENSDPTETRRVINGVGCHGGRLPSRRKMRGRRANLDCLQCRGRKSVCISAALCVSAPSAFQFDCWTALSASRTVRFQFP